jgi:AcrR family transcriptional regulator
MDRRRASVEETRQRITEATMSLHAEKGIFGTSWRDIAERADVSVATVYKHFPSLDELVPACGALVVARTDPPSLADTPDLFRGADSLQERLARLISRFFDFYTRAEPYLEVDVRERQLPAVQEWAAEMRATREGLAREALRALASDEVMVRTVGALLDFPVFKSLRAHEVSKHEAEEILQDMLLCWLGVAPATGEGEVESTEERAEPGIRPARPSPIHQRRNR